MTTTPAPEALQIIDELHKSHLSFNVMPERPVTETLHVRRYVVGERYGEAHFDRTYESSMQNSPSHLIFLSALVHTQKLLYAVLCKEFGFEYDPAGDEFFKMWPTKINVKIPELISEEADLVQKLWVKSVKRFDERTFRVLLDTRIGSMQIETVCPVFLS